MANLVPKMPKHRAIGLAQPHPKRLAIRVQRFREIDGDNPACVTYHDPLSAAVAGQEVEGESAFGPPKRVHRKPEVKQLEGESA